MSEVDPWELIKKIRMDLSAAQAKITDLSSCLNEMNLQNTQRPRCSVCGLTFKNGLVRDEHLYHQHGGPEPEHWAKAEAMSEGAA